MFRNLIDLKLYPALCVHHRIQDIAADILSLAFFRYDRIIRRILELRKEIVSFKVIFSLWLPLIQAVFAVCQAMAFQHVVYQRLSAIWYAVVVAWIVNFCNVIGSVRAQAFKCYLRIVCRRGLYNRLAVGIPDYVYFSILVYIEKRQMDPRKFVLDLMELRLPFVIPIFFTESSIFGVS